MSTFGTPAGNYKNFNYLRLSREMVDLLDQSVQLFSSVPLSQVIDSATRNVHPSTFSSSMNLEFSSVETIPPGSGDVILSIDPVGILNEGVTKVVLIPAGNATGVVGASLLALNIIGDAFNASHDMVIVISRIGGRVLGIMRDVGITSTTAPTIVSAAIDYINSPTVLTVVFSKAVRIPSLSSLSLSFSSGTARTISSIASGNGTTTVAFNLSGSVISTNVLSLVVSSGSNIQDIPGNLMAAVSFPVHLNTDFQDLPGNVLSFNALSASEVTLVSATTNISGIRDRSPIQNVVYAGSGHYPVWIASDTDSTPSVQFTGVSTAEKYLTIDLTPLDTTQNHTIAMLVKTAAAPGGTYNGLLSIDDASGNGIAIYQRWDLSDGHLAIGGGHPDVPLATVLFDGNWHFLIAYRNGTEWGIRLDPGAADVLATGVYDGVYPSGIISSVAMNIGCWLRDGVVTMPSNSKIKAIGAWSRYLSLTEQQAIRDYTHAHFGVCP